MIGADGINSCLAELVSHPYFQWRKAQNTFAPSPTFVYNEHVHEHVRGESKSYHHNGWRIPAGLGSHPGLGCRLTGQRNDLALWRLRWSWWQVWPLPLPRATFVPHEAAQQQSGRMQEMGRITFLAWVLSVYYYYYYYDCYYYEHYWVLIIAWFACLLNFCIILIPSMEHHLVNRWMRPAWWNIEFPNGLHPIDTLSEWHPFAQIV